MSSPRNRFVLVEVHGDEVVPWREQEGPMRHRKPEESNFGALVYSVGTVVPVAK